MACTCPFGTLLLKGIVHGTCNHLFKRQYKPPPSTSNNSALIPDKQPINDFSSYTQNRVSRSRLRVPKLHKLYLRRGSSEGDEPSAVGQLITQASSALSCPALHLKVQMSDKKKSSKSAKR